MRGSHIAAIGLAVVVGGALGLSASATTAWAASTPIEVEFTNVMPGQTRTSAQAIEIPTLAAVTSADWITHDENAAWSAELCASGGSCIDIDAAAGAKFPAGEYRLIVSLTLAADAAPATVTAASGVLTFTEVPADVPLTELAFTGSTVPWIAIGAGILTVGAGLVLLIGRRRREDES